MSRWKQWTTPPAGALPGGIVTQAGVVLIALLVAALLLSWSLTGPEQTDPGTITSPEAQAVDEGVGRFLENRIRAETERQTQQAAAAQAREELQRRQAAAAAEQAAAAPAGNAGMIPPDIDSPEAALHETLRLEELERRTRSLRSTPVAQSYRNPDAGSVSVEPESAASEDPAVEDTVQAALHSFEQTVAALGNGLAAGQRLLGAPQPTAVPGAAAPEPDESALQPATVSDSGSTISQAGPPLPSQTQPVRSIQPTDPPGWERIYEGSFLEAVLVTQLSGDFPGPVLATVSVPFYSADRQRVLIPRGARAVGSAQAVQDRDQSRLAIGFHRLLLPEGRWIDLEFRGLNQVGEGALKDQVNRHYLSMFAAVGAVGVLSGLTLAGAPPYGLQAGVGQGLGQGALNILDRFLNRLPTITIRAGHRLRIWFTSDVLVPRAGTLE